MDPFPEDTENYFLVVLPLAFSKNNIKTENTQSSENGCPIRKSSKGVLPHISDYQFCGHASRLRAEKAYEQRVM
jgi:hypothetical protein